MSNYTIKMERIFHPVGQGAFYSEHFYDATGKNIFNTVYDCGTSSSGKLINSCLDNSKRFSNDVDILFISHFDQDHVSGIDKLIEKLKEKEKEIKYVVLPLLTKDEQKLYELIYKAMDMEISLTLLNNPRERFGNKTKIIRVKSMHSNISNPNDQQNQNIYIGDEEMREDFIRDERVINSGDSIIPAIPIALPPSLLKSTFCNLWRYIPFNYLGDIDKFQQDLTKIKDNLNNKKTRSEKDEKELKIVQKILNMKCDEILKEEGEIALIKDLYKKKLLKTSEKTNRNSMLVYSNLYEPIFQSNSEPILLPKKKPSISIKVGLGFKVGFVSFKHGIYPNSPSYLVSEKVKYWVKWIAPKIIDYGNTYFQILHKNEHFTTACLYTGDTELKIIKNKLKEHLNKALKQPSENELRIGTIQIAHHGARNNHDIEFYHQFACYDTVCPVSSRGKSPHHPHTDVMKELQKEYYPIRVTEDNGFIQVFEIKALSLFKSKIQHESKV